MKNVLLYVMAAVYVAASINHFWHPETYMRIMPPYFPAPELLNYAAGIVEIILGVLLCFKRTQKISAWAIALMLTVFFTIHIYMLQQAYSNENYPISRTVAWLRLALQPILILWALCYTRMDRSVAE